MNNNYDFHGNKSWRAFFRRQAYLFSSLCGKTTIMTFTVMKVEEHFFDAKHIFLVVYVVIKPWLAKFWKLDQSWSDQSKEPAENKNMPIYYFTKLP